MRHTAAATVKTMVSPSAMMAAIPAGISSPKADVPEFLLIGFLRNYADDVTDADYVARL